MRLTIHSESRAACPDLPGWVEWEPTERDERQARLNHGSQTLQRLNERGGLAWCELAAVLRGERWRNREQREAAMLCMHELSLRGGLGHHDVPTVGPTSPVAPGRTNSTPDDPGA